MFGEFRLTSFYLHSLRMSFSMALFVFWSCLLALNGNIRALCLSDAAQQFVGRERNQRACHRQLVRNVVVARRVNSTVIAPRTNGKTCSLNHGLNGFAFSVRLGADETCVVGGAITSHWTGARSAGFSSARLGCLVRCLRARSIPTLGRIE